MACPWMVWVIPYPAGVVREVKQSPRLSCEAGGFAWQICNGLFSFVSRCWMSGLITASSISSYRAALARWSFHHYCQPTLGYRIKEGLGGFSFFEFQRCHYSFGSAQLVHDALQGFSAFGLQV